MIITNGGFALAFCSLLRRGCLSERFIATRQLTSILVRGIPALHIFARGGYVDWQTFVSYRTPHASLVLALAGTGLWSHGEDTGDIDFWDTSDMPYHISPVSRPRMVLMIPSGKHV